MSARAPARIVIVGGGQGAGAALRNLRALGYPGMTTVVCAEPHHPYERPPLSKQFLQGTVGLADLTLCRPGDPHRADHPDHARETFLLGDAAERIDVTARQVVLRSGATLPYDRLLIATGGEARRLTVPGAQLDNVCYLRTAADAERLRAALQACQAARAPVLIVGGGWIGLEIAAAARQLGLATTVVEAGTQLCGRSLPAAVAAQLLQMHRARGVDVRLQCGVAALHGVQGVAAATLADGSTLPAGLVVAGVGLVPNTTLAATAGIAVANGIVVDRDGRTSHPDIFAVGDVAAAPCRWHGATVRMETWNNATVQAIRATTAMLRDTGPDGVAGPEAEAVPWFWSDQFDLNLQILGAPLAADRSMVATEGDGTLHLYARQDRLIGAIGINRGRDIRTLKRALERTSEPDGTLPYQRVLDCASNLRALL